VLPTRTLFATYGKQGTTFSTPAIWPARKWGGELPGRVLPRLPEGSTGSAPQSSSIFLIPVKRKEKRPPEPGIRRGLSGPYIAAGRFYSPLSPGEL